MTFYELILLKWFFCTRKILTSLFGHKNHIIEKTAHLFLLNDHGWFFIRPWTNTSFNLDTCTELMWHGNHINNRQTYLLWPSAAGNFSGMQFFFKAAIWNTADRVSVKKWPLWQKRFHIAKTHSELDMIVWPKRQTHLLFPASKHLLICVVISPSQFQATFDTKSYEHFHVTCSTPDQYRPWKTISESWEDSAVDSEMLYKCLKQENGNWSGIRHFPECIGSSKEVLHRT